MSLTSAVIPNFNNGVSQQAATERLANQGENQVNALGTIVDGLMQRPGTEFLSVLTSNAANGVFFHTINRDTDERYIVLFTGDVTEPIEIFDLAGNKMTVQYGTLDGAGGSFSLDNSKKMYALPWVNTELCTNGDFETDTWTAGAGWAVADGIATATASSAILSQDIGLEVGKTYKISYSILSTSGGTVKMYAGSAAGTARGAVGNFEEILTQTVDTSIYLNATAFTGTIDDIRIVELDIASDPSEIFKANTVADNTFVINRSVTVKISQAIDDEELDDTVQTFADLPEGPGDQDTVLITGDDVTGFDDWYVQFTDATGVWNECIKPTESLGEFLDYTMPYRLVRTAANTFTFAPCIWSDRTIGDAVSNPHPSFVNQEMSNVFFYKNRLAFLSEDHVIMSKTGEYFNFYGQTALDVLDTDPIDLSATSKQVENLRSVAVFDKSIILLADQQQFDFGSGDSALTPTTASITPTTRFNICQLCEPVTAGANVYFVCPKTDWATIREYYVQPDTAINDAADITAHVPQFVPMGHIQMVACNSLDMLLLQSDADPSSIFLYKYYWAGAEKAQASWSKWTFSGDILGIGIIGTIAYIVLIDSETSEITLESMELETTVTGALSFRVHADQLEAVTGSYDATLDRTTWTASKQMLAASEEIIVVHPTTGRPVVDAVLVPWGADIAINGSFTGDSDWDKGDGWTIATNGDCDGTQVAESLLTAAVAPLTGTVTYRVVYTLSGVTAGSIAARLGTTDGVSRTVNGTYEEEIVADATSLNFVADADFVGVIDNVKVYPVEIHTCCIEVAGDLSSVDYWIGKKFEFRYQLTTWYLKDQSNRVRLQGRLQGRTLILNYKETGYFTVEVAADQRDTLTHIFSGAQIGVSTIGEVNLLTGSTRFSAKGKNTSITVDIVSDSYLPVAFQSGSWEGIFSPRGG